MTTSTPTNAHEFTVTQLAGALKRTVEEQFGRVRVRGEFGRVTIAGSGHMYADLKDDRAVISAVMWRGALARLDIRPEEGMEVIAEGKLTTYPGRSQYQLIIERLSLAGEGALMALLERRRKKLAAEGLFDEERKKEIPYLPRTIGVVTSPTGAVIRDIINRVEDRFPRRILLWPVLVQGEKAAAQIAAAIAGFNHMPATLEVPRPDILIVARGGGSLEDLWCFNEEAVVRAIAASDIPVIAAVGHETDWSLADYAADKRAPTPTGAAEFAVPVRAELAQMLGDMGGRMQKALRRTAEQRRLSLAAARLPSLDHILAPQRQRLDIAAIRIAPALSSGLERRSAALRAASHRLRPDGMHRSILERQTHLGLTAARSDRALQASSDKKRAALRAAGGRLRPETLRREISKGTSDSRAASQRAVRAMAAQLAARKDRLSRASGMLGALSYHSVLARGFAVIKNTDGGIVRTAAQLKTGSDVSLIMQDGERAARITGRQAASGKSDPAAPKAKQSAARPSDSGAQGSLF